MGTVGDPLAYQDGGDNERGVEQTVGDVGGEDPVVHAESFRNVPVADLEREAAQEWNLQDKSPYAPTIWLR